MEGMKVGSGGGALMLKQLQTELVRGYLAPHHRDRDCGIGSNFWEFSLIRTAFILDEPFFW
jgi:hypothetical protein